MRGKKPVTVCPYEIIAHRPLLHNDVPPVLHLGAWFGTLGICLGANFSDFVGPAYGSAPLGAMIAPLFLGLIADRFFPSQIVMGVLFLIGGFLLLAIPSVAAANNGDLMVTLLVFNMMCYMPTLGLGNSIAFANLDRLAFPKVRVWGTIGWIAAGLAVGLLGWSDKFEMFYLAGVSSLALGLFSFLFPILLLLPKVSPLIFEPFLWSMPLLF